MRRLCLGSIAVLALACGDDTASGDGGTGTSGESTTTGTQTGATGTGTGMGSGSSGGTSGTGGAVCEYPVIWQADATAQGTAQTVLDGISPNATMTWHADRGTLINIQNLEVVFNCPDGAPLWPTVFEFFDLYPTLFQFRADEWLLGGGTECQHITTTPMTLNTSRANFDDWAVFRDAVNIRLYRNVGDEVVMMRAGGTYLPPLSEDIRDMLLLCLEQGVSPAGLEQKVRMEAFDYLTYLNSPSVCSFPDVEQYTAMAIDAVDPAGNSQVDWNESGARTTTLTVAQRMELVLDPANYTPELDASNAACPELNGPGTVMGFWALLDAVTATIASKGAGLGCIVC